MDKQALQQLKRRVDLVDLIGRTVKLKAEGDHFKGFCPFHDDRKTESLVVYPKTQRWRCYGACNRKGDCVDWEMAVEHLDFAKAVASLEVKHGRHSQSKELVKETAYDIVDTNLSLTAQHIRRDFCDGTKEYRWKRDGQYSLGDLKVEDLPLFGMRGLVEAAPGVDVIITEGEKAAASLIECGVLALGTVTGAASCPSRSAFEPLVGSRRVYLWPDNDDIGHSHMDKVGGHLKALGMETHVITWTGAPPKGDAYDFLQTGGDVHTLLEEAKPWEFPHTGNVTLYGYREQTLQPLSSNNRYKSVTDLCCNGGSSDAVTVQADEVTFERVVRWVRETSGWWSTQELDTDLGFKDTQSKDYRRLIVYRLKQQGIIEPHPKVNKAFRHVDKRLTRLDFKGASSAGVLPLKWPFGIENHVHVYGGSLIVIAGSQNAGKSAFLLNFIRSNMDQFPIVYFSSEMGDVELRSRLEMFPGITIDDWNFDAHPRTRDFHDVVKPDLVNVIDFLEVSDEFWKVNAMLTAITERIGSGLAVVALQKKPGALLGRGDSFSLERPRLYLSMDKGKLTIVKGKSWANPKVDPNGLSIGFKITDGCVFEVTSAWQ